MKYGVVTALLMLAGARLYGQSLTPTVLSSSGGTFSSAGVTLTSTFGEMTMVKTFTAGGFILTQGFQQTESRTSAVEEVAVGSGAISSYPNPADRWITVDYRFDRPGNLTINVVDLLGAETGVGRDLGAVEGSGSERLDLAELHQGVYLLNVMFRPSTGEPAQTVTRKITVVK